MIGRLEAVKALGEMRRLTAEEARRAGRKAGDPVERALAKILGAEVEALDMAIAALEMPAIMQNLGG